MMRAAMIAAPRRSAVAELPLPEPGRGEVRLRLEGSGVCASSIPLWEGRSWFEYPREPGAPGHEGWGRIDAIGDGVTGLALGDRVAALSERAYAEHDIARADAVVPIPPALSRVPVPGEPLGCAMNIFTRCQIRRRHTVAIVGIGFLGALLTRLASSAGARVIALSRRPFSLEVARSCGAHETVLLDDPSRALQRVRRLTGRRLCERVIECVGLQSALDLASELTGEHGRLVIAGFHQDGPRQVNMFLWNWRGVDVVNAHERDPQVYVTGMRAAIAAVASAALDPTPLFTHRYSLDQLDLAFNAVVERPDGFLKAIVEAS
jgi:threonine dehydrogenase-like Zn-dependent dehydrogenase